MITAPAANATNILSNQNTNSNTILDDRVTFIHEALLDMKAKDILVMNVENITDITDRVIIACGKSTRHVKAVADHVALEAKKAGFAPIGVEGEQDAEWILVDLSSIVVHVMLPATRTFYDLESLWRETPEIEQEQTLPV